MEDINLVFTGHVKKEKRFRRDRGVWENRFFVGYLNFQGRELFIRKGLKLSIGQKINLFYKHNYEPYKSAMKKRIYRIWSNIKQRTNNKNNPKFSHYGGRGIKMCERWYIFPNFYDDMIVGYRDDLEIDRIDNNGNYSKENCRWATRTQQVNNTSINRKITISGETKTLVEWAKLLGIKPNTITTRILKYGWDPVIAVKKPLQKNQYASL